MDEIVGSCFGGAGDHALWAWYCRHFDRRRIVEKAHEYASMQRCGEVRNATYPLSRQAEGERPVSARMKMENAVLDL